MKSRWIAWVAGALLVGAAHAQQPPVLLDNNAAPNVAIAGGQAEPGQLRSPQDAAALVGRYGKITSVRTVGAGGLTAWTVEKNGHSVVLYTTPDVAVVFTGIIWDAQTGRNISDQFLPGVQPAPAAVPQPAPQPAPRPAAVQAAPATRAAAAMDGSYSGALPESIKTIDSLAGVKEGTGSPANTVYIIMDPRCPWCHKAYAQTRNYVKKGYTIKWIPSLALGDSPNGMPLAASLLQNKDATVLDRIMGRNE